LRNLQGKARCAFGRENRYTLFLDLLRGDDMADRKPISTAPTDGSKVSVTWKDSDGVVNESIAQYRDDGWWVYTDSHTQKKVEPTSWRPTASDDDDQ